MDERMKSLGLFALVGTAFGAGVAIGTGIKVVAWGAAFGLGSGIAIGLAVGEAQRRHRLREEAQALLD